MPIDASQLKHFKHFLESLSNLPNETSKREAFIALAATGFGDSELATNLALGAEYQVRFSQAGLVRRGKIDSFYGNLIIEFENDLSRTREHALDQLKGYCAGAWREDGSTKRAYLAVATDCETWEIFAPSVIDPSDPIDETNTDLVKLESWKPSGTEDDPIEFRHFLNRLFFRRTLIPPNAANFVRDFGLNSQAFIRAREAFEEKLGQLKGDPQLEVYRHAWNRSLQQAYGSVETDSTLFVQHTYLALLARLLVWAAIERRHLPEDEIEDVLGGMYFKSKMIANLVEDDFFRWYSIESESDSHSVLVGISDQLAGYDLSTVQEDILKSLYEQLVDPATRKDLGEFYTPDWLAGRVAEHLLHDEFRRIEGSIPRVLDPACGSGSFLRAVIDLIRAAWPNPSAELLSEILSSVIGIDVHPLAVTISRATYLLAIQDLLVYADEPITLPVALANSMTIPFVEQQTSLYGDDAFVLEIDGQHYSIPEKLIHRGADYNDAVEEVLTVARAYGDPNADIADAPSSLKASVGDRFEDYEDSVKLVEVLGAMAAHLARLIRDRRDTVHGFLLKNHYRPAMLKGTFDYVIGNPPWLTVGDVRVPEYRDALVRRATDTKIGPRSMGEQRHTELATLFLVAAAGDFLKRGDESHQSRIAFVMPRSVFTAKHHRNLREGLYVNRFNITELWDLDKVTPLFNIPSCVVFASLEAQTPQRKKPGLVLKGRLPQKEMATGEEKGFVTKTAVNFELAFLGKRSAWRRVTRGSRRQAQPSNTIQAYVKQFRQGAILYPQTLLAVKVDSKAAPHQNRVRVKTDPRAQKNAKLKTRLVNHIVERSNLFCTVVPDQILPFALAEELWVVVLPVIGDPLTRTMVLASPSELRKEGRIKTAEWLVWAEAEWKKVRKPREKMPLHERLDYAGHLTAQVGRKRWCVIYTAAGKRPVAVAFDSTELELPFIARDRTFVGFFSSRYEASFLSAFLNSDFAAERIEDWINRGLFGLRDINKRVLDVPFPQFDLKSELHVSLAKIGIAISKEARSVGKEVPSISVGRKRAWIRNRFNQERLAAAEELVRTIAKGI